MFEQPDIQIRNQIPDASTDLDEGRPGRSTFTVTGGPCLAQKSHGHAGVLGGF